MEPERDRGSFLAETLLRLLIPSFLSAITPDSYSIKMYVFYGTKKS